MSSIASSVPSDIHSRAEARWLELPGCLFQSNDFHLPSDVHTSAVVKAGLYLSVVLSGDGSGGPSNGPGRFAYSENTLVVMALREPTACGDSASRGAHLRAAGLAFPIKSIERLGLRHEFLNLFDDGQSALSMECKAHPRIQAIALEMLNPSIEGRAGELLLSAQAFELLARTIAALQQRADLHSAANPTHLRLQSTKDLIDSDLRYPWSIAELARHAGLSRRSFHQHFAAAYGASPVDYLRTRRLEVAREALDLSRHVGHRRCLLRGLRQPGEFCHRVPPAFWRAAECVQKTKGHLSAGVFADVLF